MGTYYQFSNNFHMYVDREDCKRLLDASAADPAAWQINYRADDRYKEGAGTYPLFTESADSESWLADCEAVAHFPTGDHVGRHPFFRTVVAPMLTAHAAYKDGDFARAISFQRNCMASDWRIAGLEWLQRRQAKLASGDGVGVPGK